MDWEDRIVVDEDVLVGKPTVKGTRLAVEFVIDLLAGGWTEAEITTNYPSLDREDIRACLVYASRILKAERVYPLFNVLRRSLASWSPSIRPSVNWPSITPVHHQGQAPPNAGANLTRLAVPRVHEQARLERAVSRLHREREVTKVNRLSCQASLQ